MASPTWTIDGVEYEWLQLVDVQNGSGWHYDRVLLGYNPSSAFAVFAGITGENEASVYNRVRPAKSLEQKRWRDEFDDKLAVKISPSPQGPLCAPSALTPEQVHHVAALIANQAPSTNTLAMVVEWLKGALNMLADRIEKLEESK